MGRPGPFVANVSLLILGRTWGPVNGWVLKESPQHPVAPRAIPPLLHKGPEFGQALPATL